MAAIHWLPRSIAAAPSRHAGPQNSLIDRPRAEQRSHGRACQEETRKPTPKKKGNWRPDIARLLKRAICVVDCAAAHVLVLDVLSPPNQFEERRKPFLSEHLLVRFSSRSLAKMKIFSVTCSGMIDSKEDLCPGQGPLYQSDGTDFCTCSAAC